MAQQSLIQSEFSINYNHPTRELLTGEFSGDQGDFLYELCSSSCIGGEISVNQDQKTLPADAGVQESSQRVLNPKRTIKNGENSGTKRKKTQVKKKNDQIQVTSLHAEHNIENLETYNILQEKLKNKYAEKEKKLILFQKELELFKSMENDETYAEERAGTANIVSEIEKLINKAKEDLRLYEPEKCRLCVSENSPPRLLSVPCNHAFVCYSCMREYFRIVYCKNKGQEFCLKCKQKSTDLITL